MYTKFAWRIAEAHSTNLIMGPDDDDNDDDDDDAWAIHFSFPAAGSLSTIEIRKLPWPIQPAWKRARASLFSLVAIASRGDKDLRRRRNLLVLSTRGKKEEISVAHQTGSGSFEAKPKNTR